MNHSDTGVTSGPDRSEDQAVIQSGHIEQFDQLSEDDAETGDGLEYFAVSEGKLITLYIMSFGLYGVYWFYKNWRLQQPKMDKKIFPVMRAIFSIFFTHSLFNRIHRSAEHLEQKHKFNANLLATFFVCAVIIGNLLDRVTVNTDLAGNLPNSAVIVISLIIFLLSAYPLAVVQATVNRINNDMLGYLNHKYSIWNYLLIACGAVFWVMLALGLLADSLGLVPPE